MNFKTQGVCSREISFEVENNKLNNVRFVGGCSGNTQGVARLVEGMDIDEVIARTEGINCGFRPTSCPDQLARALKQYKEEHKESSYLIITHYTHLLKYVKPDFVHVVKNGKIIKTGNYDLARKIENNGFNFEKVVSNAFDGSDVSE